MQDEQKPKLVQEDSWLEPYAGVIQGRMNRFQEALSEIHQEYKSLPAYASGHKYTGIHFNPSKSEWIIREWVPAAHSVSLVGDFNFWNREADPLEKTGGGMWQLRLPAAKLAHGARVKLHIIGADYSQRDRIPACITKVIEDPDSHDYSGQIWLPQNPYTWKNNFDPASIEVPFIYETHVGMAGEEPRVHSYREFADAILPRILAAGYNVIQMMAVQEHPYYGSFGYHVSSFFAPSSRFGTPDDLKYLIDTAHGLGLAVLLDVVHSHAVKNMAEGLNNFDGSGNQYFLPGAEGEHPQWDSKCFDYGKPEVRQFLLSNLRYWLEEFRFDGFRFDGITSMLYRSHGDKAFTCYEDYFGADAAPDAVLYLQLASRLIQETKPGALVIAEDMSGMPGLCRPLAEGGLGFSYRLAMGIPDYWIKLLKHTPDEQWDIGNMWHVLGDRRVNEKTISYVESHDQALVGDKTLATQLLDNAIYHHMVKGDTDPIVGRGIALHKMIRLATLAVGGDGWLNFMGNEFGHPEWLDFPREGNNWSFHYCRRQWSLVEAGNLQFSWLGEFDKAMVNFAKKSNLLSAAPAQNLYIDNQRKILVFERANYVFALNFSVDQSAYNFSFGVPKMGSRKVILDSDAREFGGHGRVDVSTEYPVTDDYQMHIYIPARTGLVFANF